MGDGMGVWGLRIVGMMEWYFFLLVLEELGLKFGRLFMLFSRGGCWFF